MKNAETLKILASVGEGIRSGFAEAHSLGATKEQGVFMAERLHVLLNTFEDTIRGSSNNESFN